MINGKKYDWEDVTVTLPHGQAAGITDIDYWDSQSVTARYGRGAVPRGYGRGNYEAGGSFVLDRDEWETMISSIAPDGAIYDHKPFTIVSRYAADDLPEVVDTLKSVKITKFSGGGAAQGEDNASPITCEYVILEPISWNGRLAKRTEGAITS